MGRPRGFDEGQVVRRARELFSETGYAGTSLDALIAATGLQRGSLYRTFTDKHSLYLRALDDYRDEQMTAIRAELQERSRGSVASLRAHLEAVAVLCAGNLRGCFLANALAERGEVDDDVAARARESYGEWEQLLLDRVRAAQEAGDIPQERDAQQLAVSLLATARGMDAMGKAGLGADFMEGVVESALSLLGAPARAPSPTEG